jgi:hypothetical protein
MIHPSDLVLVAVLKHPRDLEIARTLGWYRIPLRFSPKIVTVDVLAFYQAGRDDADKGCIRFAARVRGVELVTRGELFHEQTGHPRAGDLYYKIQIGALESLPAPIPSRHWKRITFLYTTGERLASAASITELTVADDERDVLWRALRERTEESKYQTKTDSPFAPSPSVFESYWVDIIQFLEKKKPAQ